MTSACPCCTPTLGRRSLFALAAGAVGSGMLARRAAAADGTVYDSMLLTCIDPRFVTPVNAWMASQGLKDNFSQFAIAGASIGVVAPAFAAWAPAFWDNLGASIQLHSIKRVITVTHRDCGAAKIAYGADAIASRDAETALHRRVYGEFAAQLAQRQPRMGLAGGVMALDGSVERFG